MGELAQPFNRSNLLPLAALGVLAAVAGMALVAFRSWMGGWLLGLALVVLIAIPALRWRMEHRIAALFGLWSVSDIFKKTTFLFPDQHPWAQFGPFLLPYAFFALAILLPWLKSRRWRRPTKLQLLVGVFILVALLNTWLSGGGGLLSKAAATVLLIMPWTMIVVAASHPASLNGVCKVFVALGVASALYGVLQFLVGPTAIELNWAQATGELSIGASHLTAVLRGESYAFLWRIIGFQADEFTFSLFMLNALTAAWLLHRRRLLNQGWFLAVCGVLLAAIGLSVVRTAWVATIALIGFVHVARKVKFVTRPVVVLGLLIGLFFMGDIAAISLEGLRGLAQESLPPVLRRTITFGTLDARAGATDSLLLAMERRPIIGYGFGAAAWITNKFGGFQLLPTNYSSHNAVVEILWYVGLPGLAAAAAILVHTLRRGWLAANAGRLSRGEFAILLGYVISMYLTGLSIAGVFLSFPFFFFLGILASSREQIAAEQTVIR